LYNYRSFQTTIFVGLLVFFTSFCSETKVSAVVLFSVGDVTSNGKKLKVGDIVSADQYLQTAAKSMCDIQLMGVGSEITVRVQENSKFQVKQRENSKTTLSKILYGTALFNVQKLGSSDKFLIETHVSTAGVRGTKLEVSVTKDNSTKVSTLEGKVSTRFRFASIEESEKLKASKTAKTFAEASESNEQFIEPKQSITTTKKEVDTLLTDTGLGSLLEKPNLPDLSKEIDAKLSVSNVKESFQKQKEKQVVRSLSDAEVKTKLAECSELVAIDLSKLSKPEHRDAALKERNTVMKDILQKRTSTVSGKSCLNAPNFLKCILDL
jgi:hypothetical protein